MKKNQLDLFQDLPKDNDGLSQAYKNLLNKEYTYRSDITSLMNSGDMTDNDYIHALTEAHPNTKDYIRNILKQSSHNTAKNNEKVFEVLKEKAIKGDADAKETLLSMVDLASPSKNMLEEIANGKDGIYGKVYDTDQDVGGLVWRNITNNPYLQEKDYRLLHEKNPDSTMYSFNKLPSDLKRSALSNDKTVNQIPEHLIRQEINKDINNQSGESLLGPAQAKNILNHRNVYNIAVDQEYLDHLLGKLSDSDKQSYINKKLGIEGGSKINQNGEDLMPFGGENISPEDFSNNHDWQNWNHGEGHDESITGILASSKHLTDDQAEHIKRHGSFEDKFNLYNNPHIDPRHGVEMFRKWNQDHQDHGYDSEQLNNKFKESKKHKSVFDIDEVDNDYWDEHENDILEAGDEYARESYTLDDYIRDEGINLWDSKDPSDHKNGEDWVDEHLRENYDWKGDNPNSSQNEGRQEYDVLNKLAEKYDRSHAIDLDDFKEVTGLNHPSEIGMPELWDEKREYIDMDDVHDKLDEFGGPLSIDYNNHDNYSIHDHPDYDSRYQEAVKAWREHMDSEGEYPDDYWEDHSDDYYNSEGYNNARREGELEWKRNHFEDELLPNLYAQSHNDDRFIPDHLRQHLPEYEQLRQQRITKTGDGANGPFLDKYIKDRAREHEYGEDQHYYEMVKDHAKANGGSIDIGTMHKLFPNQKEKWKKVFDGKGKLTEGEVDSKIAELPKTKYGISFGKWNGSQMQNINDRDQAIIRLDHSDESLAPLKEDPEVFNTFKKVMDVSKRSGHPTKDNTIAWARVDMSDPKHWMVDELQSDFGKTVTQYLKDQGHHDKASHIETIANHHKNWREAMLNYLIKEAKKHGVEKISTHSPESKASHTGAGTTHSVYNDSYGKVPKSMGFRPVSGAELPLNEKGIDKITKEGSRKSNSRKHEYAMDFHAIQSAVHRGIASELGSNPSANTHKKLAEHHSNMFKQHGNALKDLDPNHGYVGMGLYNVIENLPSITPQDKRDAEDAALSGKPKAHEHDELINNPSSTPDVVLGGHTLSLTPNLIKHLIDVADALIKAEILYVNTLAKNEQSDKLLDKIRILRKYIGYEV